MATDFFQRQDAARRSTRWLVAMFAIAVVAIVGGTVFVAAAATWEVDFYQDPALRGRQVPFERWALPALAGLASLMLIVLGSWYKISQLASGGTVVAERLGGKRIFPDSTDLVERRVLNVVEEMALASGVPVPPVFMLSEEQGINAFAAGYSPSDAVVAVTRGTAEQLTRDQLQGVIAHEFSHILNGDMRMNIRLIGLLHGILLLGLVGRFLLHSTGGRRSSRDNSGAYLLLIGLAIVILGYVGTAIGGLIKAAVSRQREYLADSSAVQFTRNPSGLSGALKRIAAWVSGSKLQSANASEASHMFFATGVWEGFTGLMATHPPLPKRIRAIEPNWDGSLPAPLDRPAAFAEVGAAAAGFAGSVFRDASVSLATVEHSAEQVGEPEEQHRVYAAELIQQLPIQVAQAVREPFGARAVLYALLVDRDADIRKKQLKALGSLADAAVFELTLKLLPAMDELDPRARLPLVDLALPALRAMSAPQYRVFSKCFLKLVQADEKIGLFEWTLHRILLRHLRPQFEDTAAPRVGYYGLQKLGRECSVLLSALAYADNRRKDAPAAFQRGAARLSKTPLELLPPNQCGLRALNDALDKLARVAAKQRQLIVEACAWCICADQDVTVAEAELFRGICDMLDCPMPPLLPGQPVA